MAIHQNQIICALCGMVGLLYLWVKWRAESKRFLVQDVEIIVKCVLSHTEALSIRRATDYRVSYADIALLESAVRQIQMKKCPGELRLAEPLSDETLET